MRVLIIVSALAACEPPPGPQQQYEPPRPYLLVTTTEGLFAFPPEGGPGRHVLGITYAHGHGLALLQDGNILLGGRRVTPGHTERDVMEFTPRFEFMTIRVADDDLNIPSQMLLLEDGTVIGVDRELEKVHAWSPDGTLKKALQLKNPGDVERLADGRVVISDSGEDNLIVFDQALERVGAFSTQPIEGAKAVLVRSDGIVWVSDFVNRSIERFAPDGRPLGRIASGIDEVTEMVELPGGEVAVAVNESAYGFTLRVLGSQGQELRTIETVSNHYTVRDLLLATVEIPEGAPYVQ